MTAVLAAVLVVALIALAVAFVLGAAPRTARRGQPAYTPMHSRRATPRPRCPFCGRPVAGLLSGCDQPDCTSREIAFDLAAHRASDI